MQNPAPAQSRIVGLDGAALTPFDMGLDQRGLVQALRYGPSPYPVSDYRYSDVALAFGGTGLRPFPYRRSPGGGCFPKPAWTFTWVRRTRFAGDSWDPDTVPLNEDFEAYDLEVLDAAGAVIRTVRSLPTPTWLYSAADQATDFGAPAALLQTRHLPAQRPLRTRAGRHRDGLPMSASPNLRLPYIDANQNQKTVTHNAALTILDAIVNCQVQSNALTAPPASPTDGQCWIVASGATGAWAGKDLNIAAWQDGVWNFYGA